MTSRYDTKAEAEAAARQAQALFSEPSEATFHEHDRKYGGGWSIVISCGPLSLNCLRPHRWKARFSFNPVGNYTECIEEEANTADGALAALLGELDYRRTRMTLAINIVNRVTK